jgi:hypothetical protein
MRTGWMPAALLAAAFYCVVGVTFAWVTRDPLAHVMRLAAWVVSAIAFVIHIAYERSRLNHAPLATAFHVSLAAALGSSGLAAAALIRSLVTGTGKPALLAIALIAWPVITLVPAFLVAWVMAAVLARRPAAPSRAAD